MVVRSAFSISSLYAEHVIDFSYIVDYLRLFAATKGVIQNLDMGLLTKCDFDLMTCSRRVGLFAVAAFGPSRSAGGRAWLKASSNTVALALNLMPFAGIAFLWFIGVLLDRAARLCLRAVSPAERALY